MTLDTKFLNHPLVTPYHLKAWESTFLLEDSGYITKEKGDRIRQELTVAWDHADGKIVDITDPDNPRQIVKDANWQLLKKQRRFLEIMRKRKIRHTYTGTLPSEITELPLMQPLLSAFPEAINLGENKLIIYGKKGLSSYFVHEGTKKVVGVSPDFYGLPTQLLNIHRKVHSLGLDLTHYLGSEFIYGCFQIIANEGHFNCIGMENQILKLLLNSPVDNIEVVRQFILGNVSPLFDALESVNPLSVALLIYFSDEAYGSDTTLDRLMVIKALK